MKRIERVRAYEKEIELIYKKIRKLQEKCKHKSVIKLPKGDTGNWDRNDDAYWYEITCLDCDKYWTEPQ